MTKGVMAVVMVVAMANLLEDMVVGTVVVVVVVVDRAATKMNDYHHHHHHHHDQNHHHHTVDTDRVGTVKDTAVTMATETDDGDPSEQQEHRC
jgi:hypothetical protein